jgi:magnesium transporter
VIVDCALYEDGQRRSGNLTLDELATACHASDAFVWIGLYEPSEEEFDAVRREFELHELAVEDAINAHQRPKLEVYDDMVFVVYKTARYVESSETVEFGEVQILVGPDYVIVVRHGEGSSLGPARRSLEQHPELLRCGPAAVAYAVADRIVDDYLPVIQGLDNDIREVEIEVFEEGAENPVERIYKLTREVLELHRATAPMITPLGQIVAGRYEFVPDDLLEYYRDVYDHLLRVVEQVETFRDLLRSILDANLTRVTVRQNSDMRKISAWVAIAAVPTLVGGIYGMNFENMPELDTAYGYPVVLAVIAAACVSLYFYFRRIGWL